MVVVMVLVQGVLDSCGFGYSTGSTRQLQYARWGALYAGCWTVWVHSLNNCLTLLSPNIFSLLAFTQKYHLLAYS